MLIRKNILLTGSEGRPMTTDLFVPDTADTLVIYTHGFNGFKDWGRFDLVAQQFADSGFGFVKFNTAHNGTTPEAPEDFADTEAYGRNCYSFELEDLQAVVDWCLDERNEFLGGRMRRLFLLGHSRGGGVVLLKAADEPRVAAVATWASVANAKTPWGSWPPGRMQQWREAGVDYYNNSRTGQRLPLYYSLYEDFERNRERFDIPAAVSRLRIPLLLCHGTRDEAVPVSAAYALRDAARDAELFLVESDHVFGRRHPWTDDQLPEPMQAVVERTIAFFKKITEAV
ncbi:alpha/beta hydrolase family protein [Flaviaesturariibacter amylovorans]|uniref:Serine aminopeptidase S33 domain-containing protein n=1 Tax=Flaviaesturariibacter amylovorans TaxID=1084520 RepID=A0ABP8HMF2_9BACT